MLLLREEKAGMREDVYQIIWWWPAAKTGHAPAPSRAAKGSLDWTNGAKGV